MGIYSVIGYEKDEDVYIEYTLHKSYDEASSKAKKLGELVKEGKLIRPDNGELLDWVQVYKYWGTDAEQLVETY